MELGIIIGIVIVGLLYFGIPMFLKYKNAKMKYDEAKRKYEKAERDKKLKEIGDHIINRPELSNSIKKVVTDAVRVSLREFRSTYLECDEIRIWTQSMFTFQLQCRLEKAYIRGLGLTSKEDIDECKEFVREIIKICHLEAVRLYPELKEY